MFGIVALLKAENFTNFLDLRSVIELGFIHMKNEWFCGLQAQMEKQLSPFQP